MGTIFRGGRKGRLQEGRGAVRDSGKRRGWGLCPQRVSSRLARLEAPRGGAAAPRGSGGQGAERLRVHQPGLPTHAALRGGGGGGGSEGGGGGARPSPPRARQPPSGRPRPRRTRLLGSAEPHTGRAALAGHGQLSRPHAAVRNSSRGRGAAPSVSAAARPALGGARGHRRADGRARGGCAQLRAGTPSAPGGQQDCRGSFNVWKIATICYVRVKSMTLQAQQEN
ncbi:PREDICTED: spidroin-1-like isoform X1 [Cercocebus atys]|uniref:spidroin-1-like isoform X1 n=1 Tax=Cercocebus atys TaxID=9531 RepID=UPI0005F4CF34|nr:PREDICTED: spidroin-1-like isoform X1 [Cercocebus atys]